MVRPREATDQAVAEAFLARHNSLRGARLGELVHPMDHPAFVAETPGGQLLGMLTYVPGQDWQQCEILTLHADQQWNAARAKAQCSHQSGADNSRWGPVIPRIVIRRLRSPRERPHRVTCST